MSESDPSKKRGPVWEADPRITPFKSGAVVTQRLVRSWGESGGGEENAILMTVRSPGGQVRRWVRLYDGEFPLRTR